MSVTLFRKGESKIWHYRFQVNGTRMQRSTKLARRGAAEALAEKAYAAAVARANGGQPMPTCGEGPLWLNRRAGPSAWPTLCVGRTDAV